MGTSGKLEGNKFNFFVAAIEESQFVGHYNRDAATQRWKISWLVIHMK